MAPRPRSHVLTMMMPGVPTDNLFNRPHSPSAARAVSLSSGGSSGPLPHRHVEFDAGSVVDDMYGQIDRPVLNDAMPRLAEAIGVRLTRRRVENGLQTR